MTFGENLKKIRATKNISQSELANLIGIHSTHISRYERNLANPTIEVVKKMSEALSVNIDELIYGNAEERATEKIKDNELLNLFSKIQQLDTKEVSVIKSLMNAYLFKSNIQNQLSS